MEDIIGFYWIRLKMIANLKQKYGENRANMKKLIVDLPKNCEQQNAGFPSSSFYSFCLGMDRCTGKNHYPTCSANDLDTRNYGFSGDSGVCLF